MNTFGRKSVNILGCRVDSARIPEVLEFFNSRLKNRGKFYVVTPNPEIVLEAAKDPSLRRIINNADLSIPDGFGLKLASRTLGQGDINVIKGREIFLKLIRFASEKRYSVFLLGGKAGVSEKLANRFHKKYNDLKIEGDSKPNFDKNAEPVTESDRNILKNTLDRIRKFSPDIVFVGLGCPKQEKFIDKWMNKLPVSSWIVVGGTFDYWVGKRRIPSWVEKLELEWFWRLIIEPQRIGRVFSAFVVFPLKVLISIIK